LSPSPPTYDPGEVSSRAAISTLQYVRQSYILLRVSTGPSPQLLANWLGALGTVVARAQRAATAQGGTDSQVAALLTLHEFPSVRVGELAAVLELSHSAGVRIVDGLAADDLVRRTRGAHDARQVTLGLTAAGQRAAGRLQSARLQALEALLSPLGREQRIEFGRLIDGLLRATPRERIAARRECRYCAHRICTGPDCPIGGSVGGRC
jgi:DNA-binding MarR family transcriptional regulator